MKSIDSFLVGTLESDNTIMHCVLIPDDFYTDFEQIAVDAKQTCKSFCGWRVQDVSDHSLINDEIACYQFSDLEDAMTFASKYGIDRNSVTTIIIER